jgi:hypothetical protein
VTAAQRARWLAELSAALEDARKLLRDLNPADGGDAEALDLCARLEAALAEARSLQFGRQKDRQPKLSPEWSNLVPWDQRTEDFPN